MSTDFFFFFTKSAICCLAVARGTNEKTNKGKRGPLFVSVSQISRVETPAQAVGELWSPFMLSGVKLVNETTHWRLLPLY